MLSHQPQIACIVLDSAAQGYVAFAEAVRPSEVEEEGPVDRQGVLARAGNQYIVRLGTIRFQPGTEVRRFLRVPEGATWGEMTLKAGNHDTPRYDYRTLQPCDNQIMVMI